MKLNKCKSQRPALGRLSAFAAALLALDIRQLGHDNGALPASCSLAIDQGALSGTLKGFA